MGVGNTLWQEGKPVLRGLLLCCAAMLAGYGLTGNLTPAVALGTLAGGALAGGNFFVIALCAMLAADRGVARDMAGAQALLRFSALGRLGALFLLLSLCGKSGAFDLVALVLPLTFVRPIVTFRAWEKRKGGTAG